MLDLFSGLGGASNGFKSQGWDVITVDIEEKFNPDIVADIREFHYSGPKPLLVWASPPCIEFTKASMPWFDLDNPSMDLLEHAIRVIKEIGPEYWIIENVRGAVPFFKKYLGEPMKHCGPFYLWGNIPIFDAKVDYFKQKVSGCYPELRAKVPDHLSLSIARAVDSVRLSPEKDREGLN